jgi:membrane-bound lytic murein transglycosylase A
MNYQKTYISTAIVLLLLVALGYYFWQQKPQELTLRQVSFSDLPGWQTTNVKKSLSAFQTSCKVFLKQDPNRLVGSEFFSMQAKDWQPVCTKAFDLNSDDDVTIKTFFETEFAPVEFVKGKSVEGLFTGYYMSLMQGRLKKSAQFNVPLYGVPDDLVTVNLQKFDPKLKHPPLVGRVQGKYLVPYYTRSQINRGAIKEKAPVIAWLDNAVERSFMEIQGSGMIDLGDDRALFVNYAAENGAPYTSIAKVLIDKGVMTKDNASMQHILHYLDAHPQQRNAVLNKNKSFVFFNVVAKNAALGAQGVALTPGYSLAVDRKWVPLGAPIWLNTTSPRPDSEQVKPFQRLMVAQDTGGAIKGMVRGDVYWGAGKMATKTAGRMKNKGHYWLLLPRDVVSRNIALMQH